MVDPCAIDTAGNCGSTVHLGPFWIDTAFPWCARRRDEQLTRRRTHERPDDRRRLGCGNRRGASGVASYSYAFDGNPTGSCAGASTVTLSAKSAALADGSGLRTCARSIWQATPARKPTVGLGSSTRRRRLGRRSDRAATRFRAGRTTTASTSASAARRCAEAALPATQSPTTSRARQNRPAEARRRLLPLPVAARRTPTTGGFTYGLSMARELWQHGAFGSVPDRHPESLCADGSRQPESRSRRRLERRHRRC